jgi:hypothetical protein
MASCMGLVSAESTREGYARDMWARHHPAYEVSTGNMYVVRAEYRLSLVFYILLQACTVLPQVGH